MSSTDQLQLFNNKTTKEQIKNKGASTAKRRQQRMRNLNITYTKSRKRKKVLKNGNSDSKIGGSSNAVVKADESSSLVVETMVYRCPYCTFWHRTLDGFHGHMLKNHEQGTQMYQCTCCHLTADSHHEMLSHIHEFSKTDSSHKRATCLFLSKNFVERYAAYLKTTRVPSSANFGQLVQNSNETKRRENVEPQNITNLSNEVSNSSSIQEEEDLLFFSDSPISTFPDISLSDGSLLDSPRAQFDTVLSTPDCSDIEDPLEPNSKKMRMYKQLNNNVIISNNPEIDSNLSVPSGSDTKNSMEIGSKEKTLHTVSIEDPSGNKEILSQQQQLFKNKNSALVKISRDHSETDDSDACIPTSSSEYSDWLTDRGAALEPPKCMKRKLSKSRSHGPMRAIQKMFVPLPPSVVPRRLPFYPQMGDEVVYFRQGHELYLDAVKQKKLFKIYPRSLPWYNQLIHEKEFVKIISINYKIISSIRLYCLKLGLMDPTTRLLTGETFSLKYHDVEGVLDFLVLQQDFYLSIQRKWNPGDRFRSLINDGYGVQMWWEGQIEEQEAFNNQYPTSMFLCYRIRWDNLERDRASPWDLEKVDYERRPPRPRASIPVLPTEIASLLYKPFAEDWPPVGDRDSECDRISAGFNKVMDMYVAKHFVAPVNLELYPSYASEVKYPMDLSTIRERLVNRFYRRVTSVQYDVRRIHINAFKFNLPTSDIVRNSSIISDLCLEIIRNRDSDDVKSMYRKIVEKYRLLDEKEEKKALELCKKANTERSKSPGKEETQILPATTTALSWRQQCKDLFEMLNQSEDGASCRGLFNILEVQNCCNSVDLRTDFEKVQEKLRSSSYMTPMDFAKDVRFIFEHFKNYYTEKKSPNVAMVVRLSSVFEENYSKFIASLNPPKNSARKSMNSNSKNAVSRKGKSLAPPNSTNDISRDVENVVLSSCNSKEETTYHRTSLPYTTGHSVPSEAVFPNVDGFLNPDAEIPVSNVVNFLQNRAFLQDKTPILNEKEQLNVDIEDGFRNLSLIESELKKGMQLLSKQQQKIDAYYAEIEAADTPESLKEKIRQQLLLCTKEKLTQELKWREHQAHALKLQLEINLIDPYENEKEFLKMGEILAEKKNQEKQSENRLNSIRDEITSLEREQQNIDRKISDLKTMHNELTEIKVFKASIEKQILMNKSKKNGIIRDINKSISAWKALEMKLIEILYQEAVGDVEKMANERYEKLEQLIKCTRNVKS